MGLSLPKKSAPQRPLSGNALSRSVRKGYWRHKRIALKLCEFLKFVLSHKNYLRAIFTVAAEPSARTQRTI